MTFSEFRARLDKIPDVYAWADSVGLVGLCLSGGGIRSATFGLGVLQAFAKAKLLPYFDYLSTVSGGSYIHQWLAQWTTNAAGGFNDVSRQLIPQPEPGSPSHAPDPISWLRLYSNYLTPERGIFSADTWTLLSTWFRNTALNQLVLFGFLASCLFAVRGLTAPFLHTRPTIQYTWWSEASRTLKADLSCIRVTCSKAPLPMQLPSPALAADCRSHISAAAKSTLWTAIIVFFLFASTQTRRLEAALRSQGAATKNCRTPRGAIGGLRVLLSLVVPGFILSWLMALESSGTLNAINAECRPYILYGWASYVLLLLVFLTRGRLDPRSQTEPPPSENTKTFLARLALFSSALACTAVAIAPVLLLSNHPERPASSRINTLSSLAATRLQRLAGHHDSPELKLRGSLSLPGNDAATTYLAISGTGMLHTDSSVKTTPDARALGDELLAIFAPVLFFALQFFAVRLQVGIVGRDLSEPRREWMARYGALSAMLAISWLMLTGIAHLGPALVGLVVNGSRWSRWAAPLGVVLVHALTLYAGGSAKSDGKPDPSRFLGYKPLDLLGIAGAPVCILTLLVLTATAVDHVIGYGARAAVFISLGIAATFLFFGWRVDVNEFSLHGFYRNRLARCYLGAANPARTPDPFTGFDDHRETGIRTGLAVPCLLPERFGGAKCPETGKPRYDGPFPIFCSTLNLTFGEDLAWQERKGASFAVTPLYSGYDVPWTAETRKEPDTTYNGYVPTRQYAYQSGIRLSEATAISGAALSPNQGYTTQPALAFLMTLFNVRLSWWIANPRKPRVWPSVFKSPSPSFGLRYLLGELFGLADDTSKYVCLADGGRFENLGMYELVRRRCKLIVVCDCEQDQDYSFQGIGKAIAKCRTDFGVEIALNLDAVRPAADGPGKGLSTEHFVCGSIRYPVPPGSSQPCLGKIVYIKANVTGNDETADVIHYKQLNPAFPQQPTVNQWFTESQFESYRRLGQISGEAASKHIW